jgi:hypothetical protein
LPKRGDFNAAFLTAQEILGVNLERIANEYTVSGDLFNRPGCGAVLTGAVATESLAPGRYRSRQYRSAPSPTSN